MEVKFSKSNFKSACTFQTMKHFKPSYLPIFTYFFPKFNSPRTQYFFCIVMTTSKFLHVKSHNIINDNVRITDLVDAFFSYQMQEVKMHAFPPRMEIFNL